MENDFKEFIQLLNDETVAYLVVGAHAVAIYGYPRYTGDIDIWIEDTEVNSKKIMKVLNQFGFGGAGLKEADFLKKDAVIQLGYAPVRIDIMNAISGVTFLNAFERKNTLNLEGLLMNFISIDDLIINKETTARDQDLLDVKKLKNKK